MNTDANRQQPQEQPDEAWEIALGIGAFAIWPLLLGWRIVPRLAEHPAAWRRSGWRGAPLALAGCVLFAGAVAAAWWTFPSWQPLIWPLTWPTSLWALAIWWGCLIPLAPTIAVIRLPFQASALAAGRLEPERADLVRQAIHNGADRDSQDRLHHAPVDVDGAPVIGAVIDEERRDLLTRARDRRFRGRHCWRRGPWICLPQTPPRIVMLACSGHGKTTAIEAHAEAALMRGWRVLIIDGKGSRSDTATYLRMAERHGKATRSWPDDPFDAWRGGVAACVTKAASLLPQDGAQIYRQRVEGSLYDIAVEGPWTTTSDLLTWLANPADHVTDADALRALRTFHEHRLRAHESALGQMRQALRGLAGLLDGAEHQRGWSWDDDGLWDLAVVRIDSGNDQSAVRAASLMLADLNGYREGRRRPDDRPMLVIIDEAPVVLDQPNAPDIAVLAEQLRSANIGLIVASQSVTGLGVNGQRLLDSGATFQIGRLTTTDDVITRIGTMHAPELAHQGIVGGLHLTGVVAAREQERYLLDPKRIRGLLPGQWALAEAGRPVTYFRGLRHRR